MFQSKFWCIAHDVCRSIIATACICTVHLWQMILAEFHEAEKIVSGHSLGPFPVRLSLFDFLETVTERQRQLSHVVLVFSDILIAFMPFLEDAPSKKKEAEYCVAYGSVKSTFHDAKSAFCSWRSFRIVFIWKFCFFLILRSFLPCNRVPGFAQMHVV